MFHEHFKNSETTISFSSAAEAERVFWKMVGQLTGYSSYSSYSSYEASFDCPPETWSPTFPTIFKTKTGVSWSARNERTWNYKEGKLNPVDNSTPQRGIVLTGRSLTFLSGREDNKGSSTHLSALGDAGYGARHPLVSGSVSKHETFPEKPWIGMDPSPIRAL